MTFLVLFVTGAPNIPNKPLAFCPHHGRACCDSAEDFQLQKQFEFMNISDSGCGSLVKSILCAVRARCSLKIKSLKLLLLGYFKCGR